MTDKAVSPRQAQDYADLRAKALAATPGERRQNAREVWAGDIAIAVTYTDPGDMQAIANAAFIAAASPDAVIALDDARRAAEADVDHWRVKAEAYGGMVFVCSPVLAEAGFPVDASTPDGAVGGVARSVKALAAERDALLAVVRAAEAWRTAECKSAITNSCEEQHDTDCQCFVAENELVLAVDAHRGKQP